MFFGARLVRGWAIQFVLVAALLPFLTAVVDLFAFTRRRRLPLKPALRSLRSRVALWVWIAVVFQLLGLVGFWPHEGLRPPAPEASSGTDWPVLGLIVLTVASFAGWLVARDRLLPRRAAAREEELTGHCAALLALAIVALLTVSLNAYALVFLLPSLHAWLWLAQLQRPRARRATRNVAGRLCRPGAARVGVRGALPAGIRRAVVSAPARGVALGAVSRAGARRRLGGGRRAARRPCGWSLHAVPERRGRPRLGPIRRLLRRAVVSSRQRRRARLAPVPAGLDDAAEPGVGHAELSP